MRVSAALSTLTLLAMAMPASSEPTPQQKAVMERLNAQCRHITNYLAEQGGLYRGQPLTPRKLTELPPATAYMAVERHIGGCDAPLTMVEYRNPGRH